MDIRSFLFPPLYKYGNKFGNRYGNSVFKKLFETSSGPGKCMFDSGKCKLVLISSGCVWGWGGGILLLLIVLQAFQHPVVGKGDKCTDYTSYLSFTITSTQSNSQFFLLYLQFCFPIQTLFAFFISPSLVKTLSSLTCLVKQPTNWPHFFYSCFFNQKPELSLKA